MLLFLDVVSPIPEFFIIEDNKVILKRKIISKDSEKLSDNIFPVYINSTKYLNLPKNLKKIAITTGPGSYTSLRVGAAFLAALKISKDLSFCPISAEDILKFKLQNFKFNEIAVFISSANNQKFLCTLDNNKKIEYVKLENDKLNLNRRITTVFYNNKKLECDNNVNNISFSFIDELLLNYTNLNFVKKTSIKPIYISNNNILN